MGRRQLRRHLWPRAEERRAAFDNYEKAVAQHETALVTIAEAREASDADRAAAVEEIREAGFKAKATVLAAQARAGSIVGAATQQAESVTQTARESVATAAATVEAAEGQAKTLTAGLAEAQEAAKAHEFAATARETVAEVRIAEAEASKAAYDALIGEINALQRRAPK